MGTIQNGSYFSQYTGDQIDAALGKALNPDTLPTAGSTNLITSGGVYAGLQRKSNPNLLDNWYFVGGGSQQGGGQFPINQRGQTRYTTEGYTIDRWRTWDNVTLEIASDGIVLSNSGDTNGLFCYLENWEVAEGTPVTLSALFAGNQLITATGVSTNQIDITTPRLEDGVYANFYRDTNTAHVSIRLPTSASAKVRAVKLELGSTQTLAHQENGNWVLNEIPNYQEQLTRCQRYQLVVGFDNAYSSLGVGQARASNLVSITVPTPVTFRSKPSATTVGDSIVVRNADSSISASFPFVDAISQSSVMLALTVSGATVGAAYEAYLGPGGKLILDANL